MVPCPLVQVKRSSSSRAGWPEAVYATTGASLLDEADFTAANLGNTEKGGGAGEVMIHELVHQWWGLGNMFDTSDPTSPGLPRA